MASGDTCRYRVLLGLRPVPLHARSAATAQAILGPACVEVVVIRPRDVPEDDDREFFVTTWCVHPRLIPDEQVIFIPEPRLLPPALAAVTEPPSLCYLVRIRLITYQAWGPRLWLTVEVMAPVVGTAATIPWRTEMAPVPSGLHRRRSSPAAAIAMMTTHRTATATSTTQASTAAATVTQWPLVVAPGTGLWWWRCLCRRPYVWAMSRAPCRLQECPCPSVSARERVSHGLWRGPSLAARFMPGQGCVSTIPW